MNDRLVIGHRARARAIVRCLLAETTQDLVIVDVQPCLEKHFGTEYASQAVTKINETAGRVLVYFLGYELGYPDQAEDVLEYYRDHGLEPAKERDLEFVEKTYGWFRDAMETHETEAIVEVLKLNLANDTWQENGDKDIQLDRPDQAVLDTLPRYAGAVLIGGEAGSCLDEIELLGRALNLGLRKAWQLVY